MHERMWDKIDFGRKTTHIYDIKYNHYKDFSATKKDHKKK